MNYLSSNQVLFILAVYLVLFFISHHVFSPSLTPFRNLTSNNLFRFSLLALVLSCLWKWYTSKKMPPAQMTNLMLLVIAYLLTEYHSWHLSSWEFFENQKALLIVDGKTGQLITYDSNGDVSLMDRRENLQGQIWNTVQKDGGYHLQPHGNQEYCLGKNLKVVECSSDESAVWEGKSESMPEDKPAWFETLETDQYSAWKIMMGGKHLSVENNTLVLGNQSDMWYLVDYLSKNKSDPPVEDISSDSADVDTDTDTDKVLVKDEENKEGCSEEEGCLKIEDSDQNSEVVEKFVSERVVNQNRAMMNYIFHQNNLSNTLNSHMQDNPKGKAYKMEDSGLAYRDLEDKWYDL